MSVTAVICSAVIIGAPGMRAAAETDSVSVGNIIADNGQVALWASDITHLSNEIKSLQGEIDYSIFDDAAGGSNVTLLSDSWRDPLDSCGVIKYDDGRVVFDAADVYSLADRIDTLGDDYAIMICRALNGIGTFFNADGSINHESQTAQPIALSCGQLAEGIVKSQSVDHLAAAPVIPDNITAGAAAWVDGKCIVGTGADNERAYRRGIEDGEAEDDSDMEMEYIRHVHRNGAGEEVTDKTVYDLSDPGGCYTGKGHTHNKGGAVCTSKEEKTGTVTHEHFLDSGTCPHCGKIGFEAYPGDHTCTYSVYETVWTCRPSGTNTWTIGCGKEPGQIESIIVIIRKNNETE